jgi:polyribonucleotide nucleotidyltransferase
LFGQESGMDIETKTESKNSRLNNLVAVTVVILSVFTAVCEIKDDNIVQALQVSKSEQNDTWAEYQSARMTLHQAESTVEVAKLLGALASADQAAITASRDRGEADVRKYDERSKGLRAKAQSYDATLETLNKKDDQFDLSKAFISVAIALSAVAALTESFALLGIAWVLGGAGMVFGVAGFASWSLHPDFIINLLT